MNQAKLEPFSPFFDNLKLTEQTRHGGIKIKIKYSNRLSVLLQSMVQVVMILL